MGDWLRRFGRAILAGSEVVLAASGLVTIWMLTDISRGVDSGAYSGEVASGFAATFLALWLLSFLVLGLVLAIDATIWLRRILDAEGYDGVRVRLPWLGLEIAVAAFLSVVALNVGIGASVFDWLLALTATLGLWVLIHRATNAGGAIRRVVAST